MLPLADRLAKARTGWLLHPLDRSLHLRLNPDAVEALSPERDALWSRLERTSLLTDDEKRAAIGYGALAGRDRTKFLGGTTRTVDLSAHLADKFNPHPDALGRFTHGPDGSGAGGRDPERPQPAQDRRRTGRLRDIQREGELTSLTSRAQRAVERTREIDPRWEPPQAAFSRDRYNIEARIEHQQAVLTAAEARHVEITRDAIPGFNPAWGVNRLTKELHDQGYMLTREARGDGLIYREPHSTAEVRIMKRPPGSVRSNESPEKYFFAHYYRYRTSADREWGAPIPIPNKEP